MLNRLISYFDIRKFSRKKKIHFFINTGVGVVIAIFFHFIEHTDWSENIINKAFDLIIIREAEKSAQLTEKKEFKSDKISDKIVFVDIDHAIGGGKNKEAE